MGDPLSISASIVALLQLSATVIKFLRDVKDAPADIKKLVVEISYLKGLLSALGDAVDSGDPNDLETIRSLSGPDSPFEQCRVALKRLTDIAQAGSGKSVGKALMWPFRKGEVADILGVIERQKSLYGLALQNDHTGLLRAIKEEFMAIKSGVQELQTAWRDQASQDILDWISPLSFALKQKDILSRRQPGTGGWFLDTDAFKEWVGGTERILWCPGLPGAGKTVLASIVVDFLQQTHKTDEGVSVAYVYCSYKEQDKQTDCDLLSCILQQLLQKATMVSDQILSLYKDHKHQKTRPGLDEWSELLQLEVQNMSKVFVIVDALDECSDNSNGGRETFLAELRKLPDIHLLVTSRPTVTLEWGRKRVITVEVSGHDEDVRRYLEGRMTQEPRLKRHVKAEPALQTVILRTVVKNAQGMFLLAQLHMDSLAQKQSRRAVHQALEHLPTELDDTYDEAMHRVSSQNKEGSALATRILSWISYAFEPLTVAQLRHALATEPGDTDLDEAALIDKDVLISVCAGLVTIDQESGIIRLVHYTTQSYFERVRESKFPRARADIARTCLTYISFNYYSYGDSSRRYQLYRYPLLGYVAQYWGDHARGEPDDEIQDLITKFLMQQFRLTWSIQINVYRMGRSSPYYVQGRNKDVTGLQVAASLGLDRVTGMLLAQNVDVNAADSDGRTALHVAAGKGHVEVVETLLAAGANVNSADSNGRTALYVAAGEGHVEVVKRLLTAGADVNSTTSNGWTALSKAASRRRVEVVERLITAGANVNSANSDGWTALYRAAKRGYVEVVERLLAAGANVNAADSDGWTALDGAAKGGHVEVVETLLAAGAHANSADPSGRTALYVAAGEGHVEVVETLLAAGANVNAADSDGCTALQGAAEWGDAEVVERLIAAGADVNAASSKGGTALHRAASRWHVEVVEKLIAAGADVNSANSNGWTALDGAAKGGEVEVVETLLAAGANVNAADSDGCTALYVAAGEGHVEVVETLLAAGANVNAADSDGWTALDGAAGEGHVEVVETLLAAGANVNAADSDGWTALDGAAKGGHVEVVETLLAAGANVNAADSDGCTALYRAAKRGYVEVVERLLSAGADVNTASSNGWTALQGAAEWEHAEVVERLIAAGANVNSANSDGWTALYRAAKRGYVEVVERLLSAGADVNTASSNGWTALQGAAEWGHAEVVERLIAAGADVNAASSKGGTALHRAASRGHVEVVEKLIAAGADVNSANSNGWTALDGAAKGGHVEVVERLLSAGPDVNAAILMDGRR